MSAVNPVVGAASVIFSDARAKIHVRQSQERTAGPDPPTPTPTPEAESSSPLSLNQNEVLRLLRTSAERFEEILSTGASVQGAAAASGFRVDAYA